MPSSRWSARRVRLTAVVDGVAMPAVSASVTFTLNGIPECSIRLPVGRDTASLEASFVHSNVSKWKNQVPVYLYANIAPLSDSGLSPDLGIPDDTFLLFEGLLTGVGHVRQKQGGGVSNLTLRCRHWLTKLDHGSIFSETSHPKNPAHYSFGAMHPMATPGGDVARGAWSVNSIASRLITVESIRSDFWGNGLYKWFDWMAQQDAIWIREVNLQGSGSNNGHQEALSRMAPDDEDQNYMPLAVKLDVPNDLALNIASDISLQTADPDQLAHQTLWDLIVGRLAANFLFAIVPTVSKAYAAPYVPALRTAWRTLYADETVSLSWTADTDRQLRAIGVLASHRAMAGGVITPDGSPGFSQGVGGWFEGETSGTVMLIPAPRWASNLISETANRPKAKEKIPNTVEPDAKKEDSPPNADAALKTVKLFLDSYAHYYYVARALTGRQGTLTGPLRFDIAPGSPLRIESLGEPFVVQQGGDELAAALYGTVMRVTIHMDAESSAAYSAFHLAYVRTEAENIENKYALDEHPLYADVFPGARLLEV